MGNRAQVLRLQNLSTRVSVEQPMCSRVSKHLDTRGGVHLCSVFQNNCHPDGGKRVIPLAAATYLQLPPRTFGAYVCSATAQRSMRMRQSGVKIRFGRAKTE
jgi:hypothetical protein